MPAKLVGIALSSIALAALSAVVSAQQDSNKPADYGKPASKTNPFFEYRSVVVGDQVKSVNGDPLISQPATAYYTTGMSATDQLHVAEVSLGREFTEMKRGLEAAPTDKERSEIRTKLAENLGKQFDLRQKRHGQEIETLEAQVKKLKDLVRKRQDSRDEIISRRLDQVLREADGLGW